MSSAKHFGTTEHTARPRSAANGSPRSLDIAARSLFESQALGGSVASVVAEGALEHHWAGLFQYAAIRTGPAQAARAMEKLESLNPELWSNAEPDGQAVRPGARLYRTLRELLKDQALAPLAADAPEWWTPSEQDLADQVLELRRALASADAEVAELTGARGLDLDDLAFVLQAARQDVQRVVDGCWAQVDRVLGRRGKSLEADRQRLLLQAFALDPRRVRGPARARRAPVLAIGTVLNDRYEIESLLGAGAFADVYRARDRGVTGHVVALKILRRPAGDAHAVRSALRELQLLASVFHPSVVQLKDHGWHAGHLWFVMPLYRGETLAKRLRRGPLSRQEARDIFEALAEALATMHRAGVRHQDVKPANVFLANLDPREGQPTRRVLPVLLDLGVAAKDAELVLAGTPAYFAPEVAARFSGVPDPPPVGPKADVFSLALTLRHALDPIPREYVGADAVDAFVAFRARQGPEPPWRADLRDLRPLFERWLSVSPDARPTADDFRRELAALTRPDEQRARRWALMRWVVPTSVAVCVLFGSIVYVLSREASLRKLEAEEERLQAAQARERAASIYASLELEEARRRQLEADVARLEERYQTSRLTREELAARLATVEAESALLREQEQRSVAALTEQTEELRLLREKLTSLTSAQQTQKTKRDDATHETERLRAQLESERARRTELERERDSLAGKLKVAEDVVAGVRLRAAEMRSRVSAVLGTQATERDGTSDEPPSRGPEDSQATQPAPTPGDSARESPSP